jgi:hypothetical protein
MTRDEKRQFNKTLNNALEAVEELHTSLQFMGHPTAEDEREAAREAFRLLASIKHFNAYSEGLERY